MYSPNVLAAEVDPLLFYAEQLNSLHSDGHVASCAPLEQNVLLPSQEFDWLAEVSNEAGTECQSISKEDYAAIEEKILSKIEQRMFTPMKRRIMELETQVQVLMSSQGCGSMAKTTCSSKCSALSCFEDFDLNWPGLCALAASVAVGPRARLVAELGIPQVSRRWPLLIFFPILLRTK